MNKKRQLRYWDSSVFLGLLNDEPERVNVCQGVIEAAERNEVHIVTSAITLVEVIKLRGEQPLGQEHEETIQKFFEQEFIIIRPVDTSIGLAARNLIWEYSHLQPKDSIHAATAVEYQVASLDTFDDDLIKLNGNIGDPGLRIGHPNLSYQPELPGV